MAHLQKFTQADYPKLLMHYERAKDENGNYHKFKNQDIDLSRTEQNYNLAHFQTLPQSEFMSRRLSELKIFRRGDVKYLCDWIITLPKGMEPEERKFFNAAFNFLIIKYGHKNVVSAYVHKDEKQPHMHFAFIPVAMDKKKNIEKLCSKDIVGRDDLLAFHEELDSYLTNALGGETGVRNGATKEGNKSIDELKRGTAVKELKELREARAAEEKRIDKLKVGGTIKPEKEKRDTVVISREDYESAQNALAQNSMFADKAVEADRFMREERGRNYRLEIIKKGKEIFALQKEKSDLEADKRKLQYEKSCLRSELAKYDNLFAKYPKLWELVLQYFVREEQAQAELERIAQAELQLKRKLERQAEL